MIFSSDMRACFSLLLAVAEGKQGLSLGGPLKAYSTSSVPPCCTTNVLEWTVLQKEEGGRRGEKEEAPNEVTVRSPSVPQPQDQVPSEETKSTGKGRTE